MKMVEPFDDIDYKVHKLVWNLHETEFALLVKSSYQRSML